MHRTYWRGGHEALGKWWLRRRGAGTFGEIVGLARGSSLRAMGMCPCPLPSPSSPFLRPPFSFTVSS